MNNDELTKLALMNWWTDELTKLALMNWWTIDELMKWLNLHWWTDEVRKYEESKVIVELYTKLNCQILMNSEQFLKSYTFKIYSHFHQKLAVFLNSIQQQRTAERFEVFVAAV